MKQNQLMMTLKLLSISIFTHAMDSSPGDYSWLGDNTKLLVGYAQHQSSDSLYSGSSNRINDSELDVNVGILRGLYYKEINENKFSFQSFATFGYFPKAKILSVEPQKEQGLGDLTIGGTFYPVTPDNIHHTTLGVSTFITAPIGDYNYNRSLS